MTVLINCMGKEEVQHGEAEEKTFYTTSNKKLFSTLAASPCDVLSLWWLLADPLAFYVQDNMCIYA